LERTPPKRNDWKTKNTTSVQKRKAIPLSPVPRKKKEGKKKGFASQRVGDRTVGPEIDGSTEKKKAVGREGGKGKKKRPHWLLSVGKGGYDGAGDPARGREGGEKGVFFFLLWKEGGGEGRRLVRRRKPAQPPRSANKKSVGKKKERKKMFVGRGTKLRGGKNWRRLSATLEEMLKQKNPQGGENFGPQIAGGVKKRRLVSSA